MSEDAFVAAVLEGQSTAPMYFEYASHRNREVRPTLHEADPVPGLTISQVQDARARGAAVLDVRDNQDFAAGHLLGSVNVGLDGRFAEIVGEVLSSDRDIILLADPGTQVEARNRLARIGSTGSSATSTVASAPYPPGCCATRAASSRVGPARSPTG